MVSIVGEDLVNWIIVIALVIFAAVLLIYFRQGALSFFGSIFSFGK